MIGDVVGHGVRAATTMSELRNALRAFAVEGHGPGAALQQLDRVVHATFGPGMIATVLFLIIDASKGTVSISRAGHPPPALRSAGGEIRFLETGSTLPLGIDDRVKADEAEYPVNPGDTLLLFTDGLVERRRESINTGFDRLRDAFANAPADVEELCDYILERTVTEQASHDDIAVLAVRVLGPPLGALQLTLPAKAASVPLVRHRLRVWLNENVPELDAMARYDLEVAWSEACTNVIRHAYGPGDATFQASAARDGDAVSLQVRDTGQWRPPRGQHGGRGIALMRELCDEVRVDRRSEGTTVTMRRSFGDPRPRPKRGRASDGRARRAASRRPLTGAESVPAAGDLAHVDIQDHDGVPVAVISGEVDISNVDDITRRLMTLPNFAPGLVVDLRLVAYMDSTGISMLHDLAGRLRERSQQLIVVCPPGSPPRRVLELTGLITRTTVVDDLAPAVQAMRHVAQDLPSG